MLVRFCSWGRGAVIGVSFATFLACGGGSGSSGTGGAGGGSTANGGNTAIEIGGQDGSSSIGGAGDSPVPGTGGAGAAAGKPGTAGASGSQPGAAGSKGTGGAGVGGSKGGAGAGGMGGSQPPNLILNGDAEAAVGSIDGMPVTTPSWTATGHATAAQYGIDGCPTITDPGPPERGKNVFSGGAKDALSSLSQTVDLSTHGTAIDNGKVKATLSAYLGGWADQEDNATISATFRDGSGHTLGSPVMLGPVTATERNYATGLLPRTKDAAIPAGTRSVDIVMTMTRASGDGDNGFADDLSLVLTTSL